MTGGALGIELLPVAPDVVGLRVVMANLYFIGTADNWVLVDAGVGPCADLIQKVADERYGAGARPRAIILTHGHFDHVGAAEKLSARWDVPVFAHPLEFAFLTGRDSYPPADPTVGGGALAWTSFLYPRNPVHLEDRLLPLPPDGSVPHLPAWRVLPTPGHSPGHISLFRDADGVLIAGDAVITTKQESAVSVFLQAPKVRRPPAYLTIDWDKARDSVQRIAALHPSVLATGHGRPLSGPQMQDELQTLASQFDAVGRPHAGRYVAQPARADERGITYTPPPTGMLPNLAAGAVVALGAFVLFALLKPKA